MQSPSNSEHLRVEFHCHTWESKDSLLDPANLVASARKQQLDRVIVTDHNTIRGAMEAQRIDSHLIIVGEEIMTTRGELLAAFVQEEVPAGLQPLEAILRLRDQGAFISVSHPFDRARKGAWELDDLKMVAPLVDAVEVYNSRCTVPAANRQAAEFAVWADLAGTVGSDAHAAFELGRSTLVLPAFTTGLELRRCIRSGISETKWSPPWFHLISRYAVYRKKTGWRRPAVSR